GEWKAWSGRGQSPATVMLELRDKVNQAHKVRSVALTPRPASYRPASVLPASQPGHFQSLFQIARLPHIRRPMCAGQLHWCLPKIDKLAAQVELNWPRSGATT